jgi:sulfite exporter TauE/SafE
MGVSALVAVFVVGLLGGLHCMGMCGGIVMAFSASTESGVAPVRVVGQRMHTPPWTLQLGFNCGRIASYMVAGALAGTVGSMALFLNDVLPVQMAMYAFANLMLVGLGLYLMGITRYVAVLERAGARVWVHLQPMLKGLMPANTLPRALALGSLWGWVPCGLVYSVLATALLAGDALEGAVVMAAFGLGTLPNLLFAGAVMRALSRWRGGNLARRLVGGLVIALGLYGMAHAQVAGQHALAGFFCVTPR